MTGRPAHGLPSAKNPRPTSLCTVALYHLPTTYTRAHPLSMYCTLARPLMRHARCTSSVTHSTVKYLPWPRRVMLSPATYPLPSLTTAYQSKIAQSVAKVPNRAASLSPQSALINTTFRLLPQCSARNRRIFLLAATVAVMYIHVAKLQSALVQLNNAACTTVSNVPIRMLRRHGPNSGVKRLRSERTVTTQNSVTRARVVELVSGSRFCYQATCVVPLGAFACHVTLETTV
ncbi:hypothetical protein FB567DRAFT_532554 [Paraphoma chrysanthemicola]|uniref:Uncharacterized protein n=1 Tax=Paraphoma chrysanthemicola TaxID=798071 RepID=A0A8K0VVU2_9PLEO|nr:hypothetical protein FB567DRAFT_532554 [Paraphoma chrysanthemicola]